MLPLPVNSRKLTVAPSDPQDIERFPYPEELTALPPISQPSFSIRQNMSPPKDQGNGYTCTSFATVAALEYVHGRIALSEAQVAHETGITHQQCNEPKPAVSIGACMAVCFAPSGNTGIVTEADWPYDDTQLCWKNPPNILGKREYGFTQTGLLYYQKSFAVVDRMERLLREARTRVLLGEQSHLAADLNRIKQILVTLRHPVVLDIPVWFRQSGYFDAGWDFGPAVHMPSPVNLELWLERFKTPPNIDGWHAIAICGFDDTTARFEFKNSWRLWRGDPWWGDQGFGTIPYDYISQFSRTAYHGSFLPTIQLG